MKRLLSYFLINVLILSLWCQEQNDLRPTKLPSLSVIINHAVINSPLLKEKQKQNEIKQKELLIEKRNWMDYIFLEGAANYGLYDRLITQNNTNDLQITTGALNKSEQTTYYGGVGLKLPLSALTNRERKLKKRKLEIYKVQYEKEEAERQLTHLVIELYYNLKFLMESMHNYFEIYQTLDISYQKANKDLISGRTNLNQFALLSSTTGKAKNDYLKTKHLFWSEYKKLENITGLNFNNLPAQ